MRTKRLPIRGAEREGGGRFEQGLNIHYFPLFGSKRPVGIGGTSNSSTIASIRTSLNALLDELESLMSDTNPVIRSRALEHFRKTVGLEGGGGVQVNVNAAAITRINGPRSFEEMLDAVKRRIVAETSFAENSRSQNSAEKRAPGALF